jgi:hypothetical protein
MTLGEKRMQCDSDSDDTDDDELPKTNVSLIILKLGQQPTHYCHQLPRSKTKFAELLTLMTAIMSCHNLYRHQSHH